MNTVEHAWLPKTRCNQTCVSAGLDLPGHRMLEGIRVARRLALALLVFPTLLVLALPHMSSILVSTAHIQNSLVALSLGSQLSLTAMV